MSDNGKHYFWGVDCGSSEIKVALVSEEGEILKLVKRRTLFPLKDHVAAALQDSQFPVLPFEADGKTLKPDHHVTATGYGRNHLELFQVRLTEIKAHFLGVDTQLKISGPYTIVDIGGQDSKVIHVKNFEVEHFVINRKCAAGTGSYIEELAHRIEVPLAEMNELEKKHDKEVTLNSYCTVFAGQEVIKVLMEGEKVENLIHSLYKSVLQRVTEMSPLVNETIVFTGGVLAHHESLRRMFAERFPEKTLQLAPNAQFCGALGAAFYGLKKDGIHGLC